MTGRRAWPSPGRKAPTGSCTSSSCDAFTAEDVKFSFHRYRGASAKLLHERVKAVEVVDAHRIRFVLHAPWPDFMVFYASPATGAAWIVPKKYIEKVGEEGFRSQIG